MPDRFRCAKQSTGLVGIPVNLEARKDLIALYTKTLELLQSMIPADAEYRKVTEALTKNRLDIVSKEQNHDVIERCALDARFPPPPRSN